MAKNIVVIGAGIVGASIAYHLAKRGAEVTVLEAALAGSGASSKSFGWINANFVETPAYFALRCRAIEAFRELGAVLDLFTAVRWHGSLWWEDEGTAFDAHVAELDAHRYEARVISASEFAALEPHVNDPPERCLYTQTEGAADAYQATQVFLSAAASHGAEVLSGCAVTGFERDGARLVAAQTTLGRVSGEKFVVAAGAASGDVLSKVDATLPMSNQTGLIVHSQPVSPVVRHVVMSPDIHFKQETDGRLVMGEIFSGGDVTAGGIEGARAVAGNMLERLKARLPSVDGLQIGQVMLGTRPMPLDGLPAIGPVHGVEGLYVASMHSGVTLAPLVGQLVAQEMLEGEVDMLSSFRPDRFT